jgi:hypothetical protein
MTKHEPDWSNPPQVFRIWNTQVERALSMDESRRSVAANGLYRMQFEIACMDADECQQLISFLQNLGEQRMWMPFWPDAVYITALTPIGASTLPVSDTAHCNFNSGRVVIWRGFSDSEIIPVLSVGANSLILENTIAKALSVDFKVYPALYGRISKWDDIEIVTDEFFRAQIEFTEMAVNS